MSRYRIDVQWNINSRSQLTGSRSKPRSMLSRDRSMPPHTRNLSGTQGNVFGNPRHMLDSSQMPYQGILHSTNQSATGGIPVQRSTGRPVARGEERIGSTLRMPMFAGRPSTMNSFQPAEIQQNSMAELHFDTFATSSTFFMLEDKIQNPGKFMFRFSLGRYVMDQRSGDGRCVG